jgi:uncharacterized tellurite resistance protein B-like protein
MITLDLFEDFILLLFIHLARVDGSMHPNEKDVILERLHELFPVETYWTERLEEMDRSYNTMGTINAETLLKETLPKFEQTHSATKAIVYAAMYDIINANGRVNEEEIKVLHIFRGWLTSV